MRYAAYASLLLAMSSGAAIAQTSSQQAGSGAAAAQSGAAQVTAGATVSDTTGAAVGTIESVSGGNATINTGTTKAAVPVSSFAQGPNGLVISMSKGQLEAAVAQQQPATIAVGTAVTGPQGAAVGKVAAVNGDLVTVQTANTKAQLPKSAFAAQGSGLVIGMTAAQIDAAAAKAAPAPPPKD